MDASVPKAADILNQVKNNRSFRTGSHGKGATQPGTCAWKKTVYLMLIGEIKKNPQVILGKRSRKASRYINSVHILLPVSSLFICEGHRETFSLMFYKQCYSCYRG